MLLMITCVQRLISLLKQLSFGEGLYANCRLVVCWNLEKSKLFDVWMEMNVLPIFQNIFFTLGELGYSK